MDITKLGMAFGTAIMGVTLLLPAAAQQDAPPVQAAPMAGSGASAGSTSTSGAATGTAASASPAGMAVVMNYDPVYHGANPANILCDPLQGQAREQCLRASSAGGGLQQASGDGD
jgi:hypothetical protein